MNNNELTYWVALSHTNGTSVGLTTVKKNNIIVAAYKKKMSLMEFFNLSDDAWRKEFDLNAEQCELLANTKQELPNYAFITEDLINQGYRIIPSTSREYSQTLNHNLKHKSPNVLYAKGNLELMSQESVAIVGSRNTSETSLKFTDTMARRCASEQKVVVSGYAKGVDQQALLSALDAGGKSIIVLPQGIMTFASGFKRLYKPIVEGRLLVVSEFVPKAPWSVGLAMARNSTIYGMAQQIIVAETDSKGGTWSGATEWLKKHNTLYVRRKNDNEHNANDKLEELGAIPLDMDGNRLETIKQPQEQTIPFSDY